MDHSTVGSLDVARSLVRKAAQFVELQLCLKREFYFIRLSPPVVRVTVIPVNF